jgi:hypothetical protein
VSGKFEFKNDVEGSIECSNRNFRDPAPLYPKRCYVLRTITRSETSRPGTINHYPPEPMNGIKYSFCAKEGGVCPATTVVRKVAFGVNGKFLYKNGKRALRCNVQTFGGDPAPGVPKRCYSVIITFRKIPPK